ncbi:MAG TPA: CorA family divalent cation transporter [Pseudolabrys sp.]|nr:CorA family divalent cation transporter [Pseudolabrys sp.]
MLKIYQIEDGDLRERDGEPTPAALRKAHWVDLCDASEAEKKQVEDALAIDVSPVNDYEPFQVSSHFSADERQLTMTGLLLTLRENEDPHLIKVTFIRAKNVLVTVTDGAPPGMSALIKECENCFTHKSGRDDVFATILDMIVDHTDNILDKVGHDLDRINTQVFQHHAPRKRRRLLEASPRLRNRQLERVLTDLGPSRELLVKLRRSVLSFRRMIGFLREQEVPKTLTAKLETFERDLKSIAEAENDLSTTAGFLLDGVVGYIGLLQNKVMNTLTFIGIIMTPPVLVASVYGMNFKNMPELNWSYGYPFAVGLMVVTTAATWLFVRWRGL